MNTWLQKDQEQEPFQACGCHRCRPWDWRRGVSQPASYRDEPKESVVNQQEILE